MYLSNTAITRGKPAITTECGCLGEVSNDAIRLIERGVAGVLRFLGMRDEGPAMVARVPAHREEHAERRGSQKKSSGGRKLPQQKQQRHR